MTDTTQGEDASLFNEATSADTLEKFENPPALPPEEKPADKPVEKEPRPVEPDSPVPAGRFREETEARRRLERELSEARGRLDAYERLQQQQRQPEVQRSDIFENPSAFVREEIPTHPSIVALQQNYEHLARETRRRDELLSEAWAKREYGQENVVAAREALGGLLEQKDPLAVVTFQQAMQHPDPYSIIMQWHRHQQVLATVGTDIEAYNKKVLENARGSARHVNVPAKVSVSPSLSNIGAGGRDEQTHEPSDQDLFRAVTTAKRR
jgi:hypothetical protein